MRHGGGRRILNCLAPFTRQAELQTNPRSFGPSYVLCLGYDTDLFENVTLIQVCMWELISTNIWCCISFGQENKSEYGLWLYKSGMDLLDQGQDQKESRVLCTRFWVPFSLWSSSPCLLLFLFSFLCFLCCLLALVFATKSKKKKKKRVVQYNRGCI